MLSQTGFDLVDTAVTEVRRTVAFRKFGGTETEWPGGTEVTLTLSAEVNGKPWDFDTNAEGKPVDAAGELLTLSRTLTRMGDDSAVWSNLRRYDEEGEPITYRVTETSVRTNSGVYSGTALRNRWTVETEGDAILNIPAVTVLQVSKIWDGEEGDPSRRPETIVYQLIAAKKDGGEVDLTAYGAGEKQPRASGGKPDYSVRWEGLPRYTRSGDEICYDVQELPVEGYSQTGRIFREKSGNVEITNTLGRNLTGFTVRKRILEQGAEANLSGYVFRLTAKDGAPLPADSAAQKNEDGEPCLEKRSDENGNVSFGTISFSAEDLQDPKNPGSYLSHRTFSYTVEEVFTDADAAHGYSNRSTAYDPAVYQIRVDVTLNGDGTSVTAAAPRYTWTAPGKISHRASFALFENELLGSLRIEKTVRTSEEDIPVGTMADGTYCFRIYTEASCRIPAKRAAGWPVLYPGGSQSRGGRQPGGDAEFGCGPGMRDRRKERRRDRNGCGGPGGKCVPPGRYPRKQNLAGRRECRKEGAFADPRTQGNRPDRLGKGGGRTRLVGTDGKLQLSDERAAGRLFQRTLLHLPRAGRADGRVLRETPHGLRV